MTRTDADAPSLVVEEERLGDGSPAPGDAGGVHRSDDEGPRRTALFAFGAVAMLVAIGCFAFAFPAEYYEVTYRSGAQPDGADDNSNGARHALLLRDWELDSLDANGNVASSETIDYKEDAPTVGVAMDRLRITGYVGAGLALLACLAAILHRLGVLAMPGPAPVMATFATVILAAGIIPFVIDIAGLARIEWIPGRLDLDPAFFTENADGNLVHDVATGPLLGFWLHLGGAVLFAVGAVLAFWNQVEGLRAKARTLAAEAVMD